MARHELLGGLIQVYRRSGRYWHCSASIGGRQHRSTTGEEDLTLAKQYAEDWFIELRGKSRAGLLVHEKTFKQATDHVCPGNHIKMFNALMDRVELKLDRDGNRRTAYSLRHTYICMRLTEGADIYQIAENCRTSVEMSKRSHATSATAFHRTAPIICLLLAGCLGGGPSVQEVANATGYGASQITSLSCSQAGGKPGHVCSYEYQGRMQTIRLVKSDTGAWRYVEQLDR